MIKIKQILHKILNKDNLQLAAMLAVVVIVTRFVTPVVSAGESMLPTNGKVSMSIIHKTHDIQKQDIVIADHDGKKVLKRVIAGPNDTVEIKDGIVYVNNEPLEEPYTIPNLASENLACRTISEDCYFLMGDNRPGSLDSRYYGEVPIDKITGVAVLKLF